MEQESPDTAAEMSFGDHIVELRRVLVRAAIVFVVVAVVLFIYKGIVLNVIFAPLDDGFATNRFFDWLASYTGVDALRINQGEVQLFNNKIAGQFSLHIKSSLIGALVLSFPVIVWQLWLFIKPALAVETQRKCKRIVWEISFWFFVGLLFGYYAISPLAVNFLTGYEVSETIKNIIDVSSYMSTVMGVSFASALIFQLPMLVRLLSNVGLLKSEFMKKQRKVSAAVLLIVSAIITPPDVFSQILIFVPLYGLYEYGITIARKIEERKALQENNN